MLLHAAFEIRDAAAVAIAHQAVHLGLQYAQVAEHLRFEFIHHPHPPDSMQLSVISGE